MTHATHESDPQRDAKLAASSLIALLQPGDALLIVPPFQDLNRPSLGVHILQACARAAGLRVSVLYANLCFANLVGEETYNSFGEFTSSLHGERLFAPIAYGLPSSTASRGASTVSAAPASDANLPRICSLEPTAAAWADAVAAAVAHQDFRVVGCTTMFQQTSASIAILTRVKQLRPDVVTIIGGANCESEMAEGMASLCAAIDVIFSGESETSFVAVLQELLAGKRPTSRVVYGEPCLDLDALPTPSYIEYFDQLGHTLPGSEASTKTVLPAESSRGCWWGQKHQCTFCGLNGLTISFRQKSPDRVIDELKTLLATHPTRSVSMADNIMPHAYFRTLIPRLGEEVPDVQVFYEQKANLSLQKVLALKRAGVTSIQPGIEALSSCLLRRMDKGVSAPQNIALLRYTRSARMGVAWNLLWGFPGDHLDDYEETLRLLPLLRHLSPPSSVSIVSIERFSPYFDRPEQYSIANIRPIEAYSRVFQPEADVERLAYHFDADFSSEARDHPEIIQAIRREVDGWRHSWLQEKGRLPSLSVRRLSSDAYLLHDTRGLAETAETQILTHVEAAAALLGGPMADTPELAWALGSRVGVELDGIYVPLATADPELLLEFEATRRPSSGIDDRIATSGASSRPSFVAIEPDPGSETIS